MAGEVARVCAQCGGPFPEPLSRRGRPRVWCSVRCRRDSSAARRAAERGARPVEVVTVATERTRYASVPVRDLARAIKETPSLAVELAETLRQITEDAAYDRALTKSIADALDATGNAALRAARADLDRRERELKQHSERLDRRERALAQRPATAPAPAPAQNPWSAYMGQPKHQG